MASIVKIVGMGTVLANLHKSRKRWGRGIEKGLKRAGLMIQREAQKIVPVDTGALKASARTRKKSGGGASTDIVVSFGAGPSGEYSIIVHENPFFHHATGKTFKFLEKPARENRKEAIDIIREEARKA